ncbi:hypothetical protein DUNSADRAFT_13885 [Dunaliella salina]|uniref:Uncharacterized protein n=1 Tax=Dunaliella salina TaxID=3046 RepID=A0ABQ7H309_DUNSA|nr:hypothetical protein DUNSADRAFT_13885 [Dunaliella salina]|eukprot:KAF5841240.1 hypothetical protein DUNSADRAFT_13885 [Dunaliella salina]
MQAALKGAEDVDDADAAARAEKEVEVEMDEFTKEPPPGAAKEGGAGGEDKAEGDNDDQDEEDEKEAPGRKVCAITCAPMQFISCLTASRCSVNACAVLGAACPFGPQELH